MIPLDSILQLHHSMIEQWCQTTRCQQCGNTWNTIKALTKVSEKVIALFEAASHAYTTKEYLMHKSLGQSRGQLFSPTLETESSSVTVARVPMSLGDFVLQDDEANILAVQVISESLVTHYGLLEDLRDIQSSQPRDHAFVREGTSIQYNIDRLLRMLGRIRSERDLLEG
ncbi:hypothetical protein MMYC01_200219 [Madurella mycetomatis]|uniref:Uncharacterized protein n=1 Tax=Madurella mycetomatis TaxID=100816 RepID=A0A175WHI4_9PEZI|nr:hypothetical protein MMYC01_200219 [Madurella mycetomatis]